MVSNPYKFDNILRVNFHHSISKHNIKISSRACIEVDNNVATAQLPTKSDGAKLERILKVTASRSANYLKDTTANNIIINSHVRSILSSCASCVQHIHANSGRLLVPQRFWMTLATLAQLKVSVHGSSKKVNFQTMRCRLLPASRRHSRTGRGAMKDHHIFSLPVTLSQGYFLFLLIDSAF